MAVTLTFKEVAKNIIKDTISSAIFIDDHALENFKTKNSKFKVDNNRTITLFNDFKKNQCLLHSFKFTKKGWKENKRFYLKNKDLLILDWQLVGDDHSEALKILDEAVSEKSLHFICIYTKEDQDAVKNEINRFFLGKINEIIRDELQTVLMGTRLEEYWEFENTESEWTEFDTLVNSIINAKIEDRDAEMERFKTFYELPPEIFEAIKSIDSLNVISSFAKLKTALSKETSIFSKHSEASFFKKSMDDNNTFYIGHTIVKIFKKDTVSGDQLYTSFLESFLKEKNIFLSLMGLEMRNRFRENSAFIGKDFDQLNEEAFFHHKQKNDTHPYIFFDFLREILKDQVSSYLYEDDLKLFSVLTDYYYTNSDGATKQTEFNDSANAKVFIEQTFRLNHFYNRLNINERSKNDALRFGDMFKTKIIKKNEGAPDSFEDKYYLCITPHCDCLNPKKTDYQFWFIEGRLALGDDSKKIKILKQADGEFISFVKIKGNVEIMYWENSSFECKPKTFFIEKNSMTDNILTVELNGQKLDFLYIESLKENYTQRLANKAFGYPMRVGIDFVKK